MVERCFKNFWLWTYLASQEMCVTMHPIMHVPGYCLPRRLVFFKLVSERQNQLHVTRMFVGVWWAGTGLCWRKLQNVSVLLQIRFDENGDRLGSRYNVINYCPSVGWRPVGTFQVLLEITNTCHDSLVHNVVLVSIKLAIKG